jgi:hypothetical protein
MGTAKDCASRKRVVDKLHFVLTLGNEISDYNRLHFVGLSLISPCLRCTNSTEYEMAATIIDYDAFVIWLPCFPNHASSGPVTPPRIELQDGSIDQYPSSLSSSKTQPFRVDFESKCDPQPICTLCHKFLINSSRKGISLRPTSQKNPENQTPVNAYPPPMPPKENTPVLVIGNCRKGSVQYVNECNADSRAREEGESVFWDRP